MSAQSARDWLLKIAQEVESCPGRWTQEEPARNAHEAKAFCESHHQSRFKELLA